MSLLNLTLVGWAKYNPRKDVKHPWWFALSNKVTEDDQLQTLSDVEFRAFIHILCVASQKQDPEVVLNLEKAERVTGIKPAIFSKCAEKLIAYGICTGSVRDPAEPVQNPTATIQDNTRQDSTPAVRERTAFDFDRLYQAYPRHEGKDAGMKNAAKQIRTPQDFADLEAAVKHYAALIKHRGTEMQFVKQWSSFLGSKKFGHPWKSYVERPKELDQAPRQTNEDRSGSFETLARRVMAGVKQFAAGDAGIESFIGVDDWYWISRSRIMVTARSMQDNDFAIKKLAALLADAHAAFKQRNAPSNINQHEATA